ncbi:hypothetical protein [Alteripontixanthobacter maritimus]|uniref:hypothetical protein n=1 Tax=Alteripontixanthobacter maritimus TaxID=2161824 RepID=UPI0011C061F2|nr:hypothetical protein [Alteripontixanthobacter maritimus]
MKLTRTSLLAASTLTLALAACGEPEVAENNDVVVAEPKAEYDPMAQDYTLSEAAAERRAEFDADAFNSEYDGYRTDILEEKDDVKAVPEPAGQDMENASQAQSDTPKRDANSNMKAREDMTWSYLDRNGDGKLSVAEYAIWAVPLDPNAPKANDETKPYVSAEQANKAADSFFYYDVNGDTYLSQREFTSARRGETIG